MTLYCDLENGKATLPEYIQAEQWIDSVLKEIKPEWSDLQKLAYIDYCIGKRVSYNPTHKTEIDNGQDSRSIWRIVNSGYGVCNGIAELEHYMLGKIGIESERVSGNNHAFVRVKNIEMPNEQGEMVRGDTLVDPTWNLTENRFGMRPELFCISYETARKQDIDSTGKDWYAHQNDENLSDIKLELSKDQLRKLYQSIGVITREDGKFPVYEIVQQATEIDSKPLDEKRKMEQLLALVPSYCPEFATCQNSTISFIKRVILSKPNLSFDSCFLGKVYEVTDESKKPVVYTYARLKNGEEVFYYADAEKNGFVPIEKEEFENRFACYDTELENHQGVPPWRRQEPKKEEDLTRSSGGKSVGDNDREKTQNDKKEVGGER